MKTIRDIAVLKGVRALVRVDFNVPVQNGVVVEDFRIRKSMPTIDFLRNGGAKVILMSHIEASPADAANLAPGEEPSLAPVADYLKKAGVVKDFVKNYRTATGVIEKKLDGECILLENLRTNPGEKKNDPVFAAELASLADIYIDDAFAVAHRPHASVIGIPQLLPSYAGLLLESEVVHLSEAFHPKRPFLFVLCGAKFETKLPLIEKFIATADYVFVGGALAHNFYKEQGWAIGASLVSQKDFNLQRFFRNPILAAKLILPVDVVVARPDGTTVTKKIDAVNTTSVASGEIIMDAGPETVALLTKKITDAAQILWNGPLGAYEKGFKQPTLDLALAIIAQTKKGSESIVGGGDTLAAIADLGRDTGGSVEGDFTFVSTGGGAMLEFLANETLPGVDALENGTL
ncbi:MAG: phosphoglycerate kinase [bacterium]